MWLPANSLSIIVMLSPPPHLNIMLEVLCGYWCQPSLASYIVVAPPSYIYVGLEVNHTSCPNYMEQQLHVCTIMYHEGSKHKHNLPNKGDM